MSNTELMAKHINTVLLSILTIVLIIGIASVRNLTVAQSDLAITVAVIGQSVTEHNKSAEHWIDKIEDNEKDITDLKVGNVSATSDRITRKDALEAIANLRDYVESNYVRK